MIPPDPAPERTVVLRLPDWLGAVLVLAAAFGLVAGGGLAWAVRRTEGAPSPAAPLPAMRFWRLPIVPTPAPDPQPWADDAAPRPSGSADTWPHDVLAAVRDPNLLQAGFAPARLEDGPIDPAPPGPRLAVGGFDPGLTRDLGTLASDRPTTTTIELGNLGSAPLRIARAYFGSSAVEPVPGGPLAADATGRIDPPLELAPGAVVRVELVVDPRRLTAPGTQAVYAQLFTNDPGLEPFADGTPDDREGRVRLVLSARPPEALARPLGPAEAPLVEGAPRAWLPELVRDGRGWDVVDAGDVPPDRPLEVSLAVANLGDQPLRVDVDPRSIGMDARLDAERVPPGGTARVQVRLEPLAGLDDGAHFRRTLRLITDDPAAPEIAVDIKGRWATGDAPESAPGLPAPGDASATPHGITTRLGRARPAAGRAGVDRALTAF